MVRSGEAFGRMGPFWGKWIEKRVEKDMGKKSWGY